jgi:drug/metabolite transporter (DMT)-like permease
VAATPYARPRTRLDALAIITMVLLCAAWGMQQALVKLAVADGMAPTLQAALRSLIATALLMGWVARREGGLGRLFALDAALAPGLLLGALFTVEFLCVYGGIARTTASRAVLFLYTAPFFVALGVHLWVPAERLRPVQGVGLLCAFAGIAVAVADGVRHPAGAGIGNPLRGDALVIVAAMLWASLTVLTKAHPVLRRTPAERLLFYQLAGSAVPLLAVALLGGHGGEIWHAGWIAYGSLAYQALVVAFASYLAWYWLVLHYPAGRLAAFSFLTPLFGMLAGAALLGETITPALLLALLCVAAGLLLVNRRAATPPQTKESADGAPADPDPAPHRGGLRQRRL